MTGNFFYYQTKRSIHPSEHIVTIAVLRRAAKETYCSNNTNTYKCPAGHWDRR
jgi:hypothetical protein